MSGFQGMDPEDARGHAELLLTGSRRIIDLHAEITAHVHGVDWAGPDRESFVQDWSGRIGPQVSTLGERLQHLGFDLGAEADQQDAASEPDGDGGGDPESLLPDGVTDFLDRLDEGLRGLPEGIQRLIPDTPWAEMIAGGVVDLAEGAESLLEGGRDGLKGLPGPLGDLFDGLPDGDIEILDERSEIELGEEPRHVQDSEAPRDLADLVLDNDETRGDIRTVPPGGEYDAQDSAQIRIQTIQGTDGAERYIVHVPPTQGADLWSSEGGLPATLEGWNGQGQPFGWANNIYAMAGRENAGANAVTAAMAEAGIPPGSDVAFVAHSQGGLVAAQLADDPAFNSSSGANGSYNVTDIFSVGSPVQTYTPAQSTTDVVNVQHVQNEGTDGDFVPTLDLEGRSFRHPGGNPAENVQDVPMRTPPQNPDFPQPDAAHNAHDSVHRRRDGSYSETSGYYGTLTQHPDHPALADKADRMDGRYIGEGVTLTEDVVIDARRI
ncbi:hypothetical protein CFK41_01005 [Brachybacterium ginsengisoli]|uniref:Alpha/beta hydrolase n=1 Tax=Brachybacterium ginsengisoli TaxID=1331682 RepID=A0A291GTK0_9MICO|nr:hypothetical protein [Brachybacterium ginsengisoli]ATG53510.1 hypothetical protein CFK41_01005 [Brachybacterium ginsengisoli]